jgi:hypothetical protein
VDEGLVAVGAPDARIGGADTGAVYLFDAATGLQLAKLVASDGAAGDEFGFDVAVKDGLVVVGAKRDDDQGQDSGSVYLFDAATGIQLKKLLPGNGEANDNFGEAVDLDGGIVAVGAHGDDARGLLSGAAYLFDAGSGAQLAKLVASDGGSNDFLGTAVAIDGGLVAVGAWADSIFGDHSGSVYLFDAATGVQQRKIVPGDGHDRDHFGISLALDDGVLAVGADGDDDLGFNSGSTYLYHAASGDLIEKVVAADGDLSDEFGTAVSIRRGMVLVGVPRDDDAGASTGAAYLFRSFWMTTTGIPGGVMDFDVFGGTPGGSVALVHASSTGSHVVTNPLTGRAVLMGLGAAGFSVPAVGTADAAGMVSFSATVPAGAAGRVFVQAIDGQDESTSNVEAL